MKQAGIYVNDIYCGILTEDEEGFHFVYDKNFSLIDSGNGEYNLAPAYDLLAVLLADPADTEEMAGKHEGRLFTFAEQADRPIKVGTL